MVAEPNGCRSNYWLQTLLLDEGQAGERDAVLTATNDAGLMTRPVWVLDAPLADVPRGTAHAARGGGIARAAVDQYSQQCAAGAGGAAVRRGAACC